MTVNQFVRHNRVLRVVGLLTAALFALGAVGSAGASAATGSGITTQQRPAKIATPAGQVGTLAYGDCGYEYLCLWEGYNYTGTIHQLYNCQTYYTNYPIHSVYNHQTPGTRASFRDINNVEFWVSPAPNWRSGNTDGIAGSLNRAWYVKPC